MKVLFLHLSDIHIKSETTVEILKIDSIIQAIRQCYNNIDACLVIVSGDISFSGEKEQFLIASDFLYKLRKSICYEFKIENYYTYIVPGNHDISNINQDRNGVELSEIQRKRKFDELIEVELTHLDNFFDFSSKICPYKYNKLINIKNFKFRNGYTIRINLINSAPFSLYGGTNEDKGKHYLPHDFMKLLESNEENCIISIMHHGPEWFIDDCKQYLNRVLFKTSNIIFLGHEHYSHNGTTSIEGNDLVQVSTAIAYKDIYAEEEGFNALLLDTEKNVIEGEKFVWNGNIFDPYSTFKPISISSKGIFGLSYSKKFQEFLKNDNINLGIEDIEEYFIFPSLEIEEKVLSEKGKKIKKKIIKRYTDFLKILDENNSIIIKGSSWSGKTTLAKMLCLHLLKDYIPVFIDSHDITLKTDLINYNGFFEQILKYQFDNKISFNELMQTPLNKKVILIDDSHLIQHKDFGEFLKEIQRKFKCIIFKDDSFNFDLKTQIEESIFNDEHVVLSILPFYYNKREELISKLCKTKYNINTYEQLAKEINEDINKQISYFQLTPAFINKYVYYYLFSAEKNNNEMGNIWSAVFEANIIGLIKENKYEYDVSEVLVILDYVAYYMYVMKQPEISELEFMECIDKYNQEFSYDLKGVAILDIAQKARLINYNGNKIHFIDRNIFAYFVAKYFNREITNGELDSFDELLNKITIGINSDIVLFIIYLTSNIKIIKEILQQCQILMKGKIEFSIEEDNISCLSKIKIFDKLSKPTKKEKARIKKQIEMNEQHESQNVNKEVAIDVYDSDEVSMEHNYIEHALIYLKILAKILVGFRPIMKGELKKEIVEVLYKLPNKIIYFCWGFTNEKFDDIVNEIVKELYEPSNNLFKSEEDFSNAIKQLIPLIILAQIETIYDFTAKHATNKRTILDLKKYSSNSLTNKIQILFMSLYGGSFEDFSQRASFLNEQIDKAYVRNIIATVVRYYCLTNDIPLSIENEKFLSSFFSENNIKEIKNIQSQNRFIKK